MRIDARTRGRESGLRPLDEVTIERVFGHHETQRADRCDDVATHPVVSGRFPTLPMDASLNGPISNCRLYRGPRRGPPLAAQ